MDKERKTYMRSGEGDSEAADQEFKEKAGWEKFFKKIKKETNGSKRKE